MKTIALSMLFSLAVILCQQQTLCAQHITTVEALNAANPLTNGRCLERRLVGGTMCSAFADDSPTNSLVPVAGVNRLVPVAGAGYNPGKGASYNPGKGASVSSLSMGTNYGDTVIDGTANLEHGPGPHNSLEHGPGMHALPWHRGY